MTFESGRSLWQATILAYLTPVKDDFEEFQRRFNKLFSQEPKNDAKTEVEDFQKEISGKLLPTQTPELPTYVRKFETKVKIFFKVNLSEFSHFIQVSVFDSQERTLLANEKIKIVTISKLLQCNIEVKGDFNFTYGNEKDILNFKCTLKNGGYLYENGEENVTAVKESNISVTTSVLLPLQNSKNDLTYQPKQKLRKMLPTGARLSSHGFLYELKLSLHFLYKGKQSGINFCLATQMDDADSLDDFLIRCFKPGESDLKYRFIQAKHIRIINAEHKYANLNNDKDVGDNKVGLPKYFRSFCKIKDRFARDELDDFVLASNIPLGIDGMKVKKQEFEMELSKDIFFEFPMPFYCPRYKINELNTELEEKLRNSFGLRLLAKDLVDILKKKEKKKVLPLSNYSISYYHVALLKQNIIETVEKVKFRDEFFMGENKSLANFRKCFQYEWKEPWESLKDIRMGDEFVNFFKNKPTLNDNDLDLQVAATKLAKYLNNKDINELINDHSNNEYKMLENVFEIATINKFSDSFIDNLIPDDKVKLFHEYFVTKYYKEEKETLRNTELTLPKPFGDKTPFISPVNEKEIEKLANIFIDLMKKNIYNNSIKYDRNCDPDKIIDRFSESVFVLIGGEGRVKFRSSFFDGTKLGSIPSKFKKELQTKLENEIDLNKKFDVFSQWLINIPEYPLCYENRRPCDDLTEPLNGDDVIDVDKYIEEFIQKLVFVQTPDEDKFDDIIGRELGTEFNLLNSKMVTGNLIAILLNWVSKAEAVALDKNDVEEYFESIRQQISTFMLYGGSAPYRQSLKNYNVQFQITDFVTEELPKHFSININESNNDNDRPEQPICGLKKFLIDDISVTPNKPQILWILTNHDLLTAIKIEQKLSELALSNEIFKRDDTIIFNPLSKLLKLEECKNHKNEETKHVTAAFGNPDSGNILIVVDKIYEKIMPIVETSKRIEDFCSNLMKILENNGFKKLVVISSHEETYIRQQYYTENSQKINDSNNFSSLSNDTQQNILDTVITFQENPVKLVEIIDIDSANANDVIDNETLVKILKKEFKEIEGSVLESFQENENKYYINRKIRRKELLFESMDKVSNAALLIEDTEEHDFKKFLTKEEYTQIKDNEWFSKSTLQNGSKIFVINTLQERDYFSDICKKFKNEYTCHWLKAQTKILIWYKSYGSIDALRSTLQYSAENFFEEDLLNYTSETKIMIISDAPGMGKSTIFTKFIELMPKKYKAFWKIRINLNDHTNVLNELKKEANSQAKDKPEDNTFMPNFYSSKNPNYYIEAIIRSIQRKRNIVEKNFEMRVFEHCFKNGKILPLNFGCLCVTSDFFLKLLDINKLQIFWFETKNGWHLPETVPE